jgi:two-component system, LuxR family, response regulator FixJ
VSGYRTSGHTPPLLHSGTVHLVDDDPAVLTALRGLFESVPLAVETYDRGDAFLERYVDDGPACLVLELAMPGMSGLALQRVLLDRSWELPVIFLSRQARVPDVVEALKGGAADFIEKPFVNDVLLERVQAALARDGVRRLDQAGRVVRQRRLAGLTRREHDVASRVVAGLPNKVIAAELGISPRTVEVYRAQGMRKTGARSVAELVRLFLDD